MPDDAADPLRRAGDVAACGFNLVVLGPTGLRVLNVKLRLAAGEAEPDAYLRSLSRPYVSEIQSALRRG